MGRYRTHPPTFIRRRADETSARGSSDYRGDGEGPGVSRWTLIAWACPTQSPQGGLPRHPALQLAQPQNVCARHDAYWAQRRSLQNPFQNRKRATESQTDSVYRAYGDAAYGGGGANSVRAIPIPAGLLPIPASSLLPGRPREEYRPHFRPRRRSPRAAIFL